MPFWKRKKDEDPSMGDMFGLLSLIKEGEDLANAGRFEAALAHFNKLDAQLPPVSPDRPNYAPIIETQIALGQAQALDGLGRRAEARGLLRKVQTFPHFSFLGFMHEAAMDVEEGAYIDSVDRYLAALESFTKWHTAGISEQDSALLQQIMEALVRSVRQVATTGDILPDEKLHRLGSFPLALTQYAFVWIVHFLKENDSLEWDTAKPLAQLVVETWASRPVDHIEILRESRQRAEQIIENPELVGGPIPLVAKLLPGAWAQWAQFTNQQ